jgi:hypothetical protein
MGDWPNTIVEPLSFSWGAAGFDGAGFAAGFAAAGATGEWPKTMVEPLSFSGAAGFGWADLGAAGTFTLPAVWNIIVRPAPSSAGAGAAGFDGAGILGAWGAWGAGGAAGAGLEGVAAAGFGAGAAFAASAGAGSRITLKVFWHLPQRMVSPCGPTRASSTL